MEREILPEVTLEKSFYFYCMGLGSRTTKEGILGNSFLKLEAIWICLCI